MSEVTTDFLEKLIDPTWRITYTQETVQLMARELLALRSRDAGDGEVELLHEEIGFSFGNPYVDQQKKSREALENLRLVAITRGQQLREARAEIERLKTKQEHKSQQIDSQVSLVSEMQSQIATLTSERDEARKELEDAQRQEIETIAAVINHRKLIDEQKQKIDFLTAELAALTSCPAMEEVDALVHQESLPLCERESCTDKDGVLFQRLAAIARRSIASREEEAKRADEVNKEYSDFIEKIIQAVKDGLSGQRDGMFQALRDCEAFAMSANMDQLFRGVVCQFGLVQQGHIPTIEAMLGEGASWEEIGLKIGWCHKTAEQHYNAYLKGKRDNDHA